MTISKFKISSKVLSALLCMSLLFSLVPLSSLTVFAEDTPAEAPEILRFDTPDLVYGSYKDVKVSVTVNEKEGYTYSYQWYNNHQKQNPIVGETSNTYTLPNNLARGKHSVFCVVTGTRKDNGLSAETEVDVGIYVSRAKSSIANAPEAKTDLQFNGEWQELVTPGTANGGSVWYLVTTQEIAQSDINNYIFSSAIPKAANVGTYYVWYKVNGDWNHKDTEAENYVTVSIGKAQIEKPAENNAEFIYNGQEQSYFQTDTLGDSDTDPETPNDPLNPTEPTEPVNPPKPDTDNNITPEDNYDEENKENNENEYEKDDGFDTPSGTLPPPGAPTAPVVTFDPYPYDIVGNTQTEAGTYTVTVTLKDTDNYEWADGTTDDLFYTFTITEADIFGATITLSEDNFVYNGQAQKPTATVTFNGITLQEDVDYELRYFLASNAREEWGGKPIKFFGVSLDSINADKYYVQVQGIGNFEFVNSEPYTISPAPLTVKAKDKTITYGDAPANNGVTYSGFVNGENEAVLEGAPEYAYSYTQYGDVGNAYTITPMGLTSDNYEIKFEPGTLTVAQKALDIKWSDDTEFIYNGTEQAPTVEITTPNPYVSNDDVHVTVSSKQINANKDGETYTATVEITGAKAGNYKFADGTKTTKEFTIAKKTVDLSGVKWNYSEAFKCDGECHSVSIDVSTLPEGVSILNYTGHVSTETGKLRAAAAIGYDDNHTGEATLFLDWEIVNNWTPTEYNVCTPNGNGWLNDEFVIVPAEGYLVSLTNIADGEWSDRLTCSAETDNGSITFYLKNTTDGTISLGKTVTYKIDKTPTTGKVEFVERNSWKEFVNNITFGLFFKDEVTVKATANDNLSGVASIEYAISDKALTLDEVKTITEWASMPENGVGVTIEDAKKFVYFICITDNAGNVTYLSTDGAEYDTTAPVIMGIENGATYYTTQVVTVEDKNLASVTLNGEKTTSNNGMLTLAGNVDVSYNITVTDEADNVTTVVVTMKEIASVKETIKDITEDTVTSADKDTVQGVIDHVDELLKDDDLTEDENKALEDIKTEAEKLIDKVEETDASDETEAIVKVKDITSENVTTDDKKDLEKAKEDLEKALEDYKDNLTEDEKNAIQDEIDRIDDALDIIEKVESVEEQIDMLLDTIKKDDEDAKKALDDAKAALAELNKPADTASPNTGDSGNMFLWVALLLIGGGTVVTLTVIDRKKRTAS